MRYIKPLGIGRYLNALLSLGCIIGIVFIVPTLTIFQELKLSFLIALAQPEDSSKILFQIEGALEEGDQIFEDGSLYDEHLFQGKAGETISITLESLHFNTYLILLNENGEALAQNDDIDSAIISRTRNSWITLKLPADGQYRIFVNTFHNWEKGDYRLTIASEQTTPILSDAALKQAEANQLMTQGVQASDVSQFREALVSWQAALDIFEEVGSRASASIALSNLGAAYRNLGQYQQAIELQTQSLEIASQIGDRAGEGAVFRNLGAIYDDLGQYQRAIELYEQDLAINRELGNRRGEGQVLGNLGIAYVNLGQYQKAIELHRQNLAIAREIDDLSEEGRALGNLGVPYRRLGEYQTAMDLYQQSLNIARETSNRLVESSALANLGIVHLNLGQYQQAIDLYQQDLAITLEIGNRAGEALSLHNLGEAFFESDNFAESEIYFLSAIDIFESLRSSELAENQRISLVETQLNSFQALQRVLAEQGETYTALETSERGRASVFFEEGTSIN